MEILRPRLRRISALTMAVCLALGVPAVPAAAEDDIVAVSSQVLAPVGAQPAGPLAGVEILVERWRSADGEWEAVTNENNSTQTEPDGSFTLHLEADSEYTIRFTAPDTYPVQYLGGGPAHPSGRGAADWAVATFVARDGLPSAIRLYREARFSVSGLVTGDEDAEAFTGNVDLYEITDEADPPGEYRQSTPLDPDGAYVFHGLAEGRYTVTVEGAAYLTTFLGDTTQPELAESFVLAGPDQAIGEITMRRGAPVAGLVTARGHPVELAHVTPLRWDEAGGRWLEPAHYDGETTDTLPDGSWQRLLEPGAIYTLHVDASDASSAGELPATREQYLGGGIAAPSPDDAGATFELLPVGHEVDVDLAFPRISAVTAPTVSGRAAVGSSLTSTAGSWSVSGVTVTRQWLRAGTPIPGATGATYSPTAADVGSRLSVRVTATRAGYAAATVTTAATSPVVKATATTAIELSRTSARYGAKVRATVHVRAAGGIPSGPVTLRLGSTVLATARPTVSGTTATATFDLPRDILAGTHRVTAAAATSPSVTGSAGTARLTITKAKASVKVTGPARWRLTPGQRPRITVRVKGTKGGPTPRGKVVVKIGTKKYTKPVMKGKVTVRGPRLAARGKVSVRVTYRPVGRTYAKPKPVTRVLRVR